jgi:hypothetical protein
MIFAGLFVLFFALDILVEFSFQAMGMLPMSFLISAVSIFIVFLLWSVNRSAIGRNSIRFNRTWMFYLGGTASLTLLIRGLAFYVRNFEFFHTNFRFFYMYFLNSTTIIASGLIFIYTLFSKKCSPAYRWHLCVSLYTFIRNLAPSIIWEKIPVLVWRFDGILDLPILFCLLMVAVKWIRVKYRFEETVEFHFRNI